MSALSGAAPTAGTLVVARLLQGAAGGMLAPQVSGLIQDLFRGVERGRAFGILGATIGLSTAAGPVAGGLILAAASGPDGWRWVFYVNVPVGAIIAAVVFRELDAGARVRPPGWGWLVDASLLSIAGAAVMFALTKAAEDGPSWLLGSFAAWPFMAAWLRRPDGRTVTDLLRIREVLASHVGLLCQTAAVFAVMFVLPFHLQAQGVEPARMGLMLLAFPCAAMATGLVAGLLADAWSPVAVCLVGGTVLTVGILLLTPVGIGTGMFAGPVVPIAMSRAPADLLGTTAASTSVARQIGLGLGPALATMAWAAGGYSLTGLSAATIVAVLLTTVGTLGLLTARHPRRTTTA
jgi:MFS family permease